MKLSMIARELSAVASWAARIAPSKPAIPVLAGVLLDASDVLRCSATDFEVFATATITAATIGEPGRAVIVAGLLAAVAKTLPETAEVHLEATNGKLTLRCGRLRAGLPMMDASDWPTFPATGEEIGQVQGAVLTRTLSRLLPVLPPASNLPQLTGLLFDATQTPTLIASDSCRMATATLDWQPAVAPPRDEQLIIPADLLRAVGESNGGAVSVLSDGNSITLRTATHQTIGRLLAGRYPGDWRALMDAPASNLATSATVATGELRRAIEQVSAVAERDPKAPQLIRLAVTADSIGVSLAATARSDAAQGDGATEVDLHSITGEPITVGVATQFALDALRCLGSPMTTLSFPGPSKTRSAELQPFLLLPADDKGSPIEDGYQHLIVPRKIVIVE